MAKNLLNPTAIKAAKPESKDKRLNDGEGLYLLIKSNGAQWWRFDYSIDGKRKTLSLGVYPEVSLADARIKATAAREQVAKGINPGDLRKQDKVEKIQQQENQHRIDGGLSAVGSFQFVAEEWISRRMADKSESHTKRVLALLVNDVYPWIGQRPIHEITPPQLSNLRLTDK